MIMKINYVTKKLKWGFTINLLEWYLVPEYHKDNSLIFSVQTRLRFLIFDIKIVRQK